MQCQKTVAAVVADCSRQL